MHVHICVCVLFGGVTTYSQPTCTAEINSETISLGVVFGACPWAHKERVLCMFQLQKSSPPMYSFTPSWRGPNGASSTCPRSTIHQRVFTFHFLTLVTGHFRFHQAKRRLWIGCLHGHCHEYIHSHVYFDLLSSYYINFLLVHKGIGLTTARLITVDPNDPMQVGNAVCQL